MLDGDRFIYFVGKYVFIAGRFNGDDRKIVVVCRSEVVIRCNLVRESAMVK
jgi:hypothetical protein